jgi:hypothetical protein
MPRPKSSRSDSTRSNPNLTTDADLELLAELGVDITPEQPHERSAQEERIIAGFEDIERFFEDHGRLPQHGADRDIFERLYAVRLDRLREFPDYCALLQPFDRHGLLTVDRAYEAAPSTPTDEELLAELGVDLQASRNDITQLVHVRSRQEIKAAEEIAQRTPCADFADFESLFQQIQQDLVSGARQTMKYRDNAEINQGDLFILDGQKAIIAEMGELFISDYGLPNCRLRVVYDNGTESDLLLRSLQRALNKDKTSRRITKVDLGPLFSQSEQTFENPTDQTTGYIYILRSQSDHPFIVEHRSLIHKIGVTTGNIKKRIAHAKKDPTYLLADVEVVGTFKLANTHPQKLEGLLHRFFDVARLDLELLDRFGEPVKPKEWFFVPLEVIETAIQKIQEGAIEQFQYDPKTASLILSDSVT